MHSLNGLGYGLEPVLMRALSRSGFNPVSNPLELKWPRFRALLSGFSNPPHSGILGSGDRLSMLDRTFRVSAGFAKGDKTTRKL
jgi:hypothetical protein